MPFNTEATARFGGVASALVRKGVPIGQMDALIASHALALKAVLVTNNERHFERVPGLHLESWA
jgi:tRNA(fMet)-specific endonuclease VapC